MTNPAVFFAWALIASLPILVISVVGVVLSRSKIPQSHFKARRLATIGFSLLGLQVLVGAVMRTYADTLVVNTGRPIAMVNVLSVAGVVTYLLLATSLILLLLAVLADRESPSSSRGAI
jgi:hypothetical protein